MRKSKLVMIGILVTMLLAFAIAGSATTEITVPANINGSASNSSAQVITVAITAKATTLNFTHLNISYSTRGGANVTLFFFNVSNATTDTISAPALDLRTLPEGVLDILVKACNGTACGVGTGNQNGTMNVQLNPPAVTVITPTQNLEDTQTLTVTTNETSQCRWTLVNHRGYRNLTTNALTGNSTTLTVTSPLGSDKDQTFYFACEDEFQNSGPSFSQRLIHKGTATVGGGVITSILTQPETTTGGQASGGLLSIAGGDGTQRSNIVLIVVGILALLVIVWIVKKVF